MKEMVTYWRALGLEAVFSSDCRSSYPLHTHARSCVLGLVMRGSVRTVICGTSCVFGAGEQFFVPVDAPHSLESADGFPYSLLSVCLPCGKTADSGPGGRMLRLKELILESPGRQLSVQEMARLAGASPYHFMRTFKAECGLSPHQFQMQCRIRMAQRLLEAGMDAACAAGFFDQSHFSRCFRRAVALTPGEYRQSVRRIQQSAGKNFANRQSPPLPARTS
ncbi:MAG: helix-turn-helix transcriptional regulator [Treponema sp.]|nr:helix-turn-helix transcriptional regulator [Treponema sp.]